MHEVLLGTVIHYYSRLGVAALSLRHSLRKGDRVHILGHTTDVEEAVESMEIDHRQIVDTKPGDDVAIKVREKVRAGDKVYLELQELSPGPALVPVTLLLGPG
jgi:putative protease